MFKFSVMLSIENLQEYCCTCLVKLEGARKDDVSKPISIKQFPELEHLIKICLANNIVVDDNLCCYIPFLCRCCFEKWLEFLELYQLAIKTDKKIRKLLEKANQSPKRGNLHNNVNEYFTNAELLVDIQEIEKYEIASPFYTNDLSNNPSNNTQRTLAFSDDSAEISETFKDNAINSTKLVTEQNEETSNSSENTDKFGFTSEEKKKVNEIKNKRQRKGTGISLRVLKSTCKNRKSLLQKSNDHKQFKTSSEKVTIRNENVAKKVRYQCEQCNKYFWEKNKYDGHMKQVHEGIKRPYKCHMCDKAYNLYKTLLQHKRESHGEKVQEIFKCDKCDKMFKTGIILRQHLVNKHSEQKEAMRSICDQCGFIAAHQYSLSRHIINKHSEPHQIKCDLCPKVFKTQYSLKYHILGKHNSSNIKPFKCTECEMGFTRKTLLNQHKRTHLKYTERIKCDFEGCEVRFVKHGDKTHHMRLVHLKVKQHICDYCGEAFGAMQTLRHHRFIHTGEKPYKCNVCGHGFRQRTAMKTHRKTHFGKGAEKQDPINNLPETNLSLVNDCT